MTNEERDLISQFVARVGGNAAGGFSRAVPTSQPALPPIDPEADRFIADQFASHPEARYRVTQMAVVQEAALAEAANRIQRLQAELQAVRQQPAQPAQSKGFLGGLFGGGGGSQAPQGQPAWNQGAGQQQQYTAANAVPPPQYPPNMQPGMFGRAGAGGSGFLGSALTTAAGVAGGMVAGNALMDLFSGHHGGGMFGGGEGFGGGMPGETTIVNNYGDAGGGATGGGEWDNAVQGDAGWDNSGGGGGFDDGSGGGGGGFDSGGGGGFDDNSL